MIITKIIGGMGNQMFQYAMGRALSLKRGQPLRLDVSDFSGYGLHHGFELNRVFNCQCDIVDEFEMKSVLGWQSSSRARKLMVKKSLAMLRSKGFIIEPHFHFWSEIHNAPENCYIDGYWQSEKYFGDVSSIIREDFTFKMPLTAENAHIVANIGKRNTVSIHIRRGDYATDPTTNATHGLCPLDFYRHAIKYFGDRIAQPYFYVFSDDINWVRKNLAIDFPCQYIDHNQGTESYNDMRLMSLCNHNIIANSSFSWWGAWLNQNSDKIVIAPKKWFANENDVKDLIPQKWLTL